MAKDNKSANGVADISQRCPVEGCNKTAARAGFCNDHFSWFKEGLVNKKGDKPRDFDKKYQAFQRRKHNVA